MVLFGILRYFRFVFVRSSSRSEQSVELEYHFSARTTVARYKLPVAASVRVFGCLENLVKVLGRTVKIREIPARMCSGNGFVYVYM